MSPLKQSIGLLFFLILCFGVAWLGSQFTTPSIPYWYAGLEKPTWNPPNWLFGPVWSVLYLMMAIAGWLVWRRSGLSGVGVPLAVFALQLALNLLWSIIFFGRHNIGLAFLEIILLWLAIVGTILAFRRASPTAAWLLVPYVLWVSFASVLNYTIWKLNP